MASAFYQKYRLKWPWTPTQVTNVDQMFQEIYTAVLTINQTLDDAITTGLANAAPSSGTYLTVTNQSATLPNSRQLFAGTGVTFDDSVAFQRTINVSVSPGGSSGDIQYNNGGVFAGSVLKQPSVDIIEQVDGTTTQQYRFYNTTSGGGANYERLTTKVANDFFSESAFQFLMEKAGTGVTKGISLKTAGSISFEIPGAFPVVVLYHDPTSNGGISLIPNGSGFVGTIFCDQSGSLMQTPGGFGVPHMIGTLTASTKALLIGHSASGADFNSRFLNFDTTHSRIEVGNNPAGGGTGSSRPIVFDSATNGIVANLPTGPVGSVLYVTNALAPAMGANVAGGGAAKALVWYNGANWTVIGV